MNEQHFETFRKELLDQLANDDWRTEPYFYMCNSFYDIFIGIYQTIHSIEFKESSKNSQELQNNNLKGHYISGRYDTLLTDEEKKGLHAVISKIGRHDAANISSPRGNSYLIFEDYEYSKKKKENNHSIKICSNSPTGKEENIPRFIISQIAPKCYAILPLKNIKEIEFVANGSSFSFGIPCSVFPTYSGIGDVFFYNDTGLEFSRLNIVDVFNSHKDKVESIGNTFGRSNLKSLIIRLFQESSFIYKVSVSEKAYSGYLREQWSEFTGRIDLNRNEWLSIVGSSSSESLK